MKGYNDLKLLLGFLILISGCDQISVRNSIIDGRQAIRVDLPCDYWMVYSANDLNKRLFALEVKNLNKLYGETDNGPVWIARSRDEHFYFKFIKSDRKGHYIAEYQGSQSDSIIEYNLPSLSYAVLNSSDKCTLYRPNSRVAHEARNSPYLKELQNHIEYQSGSVIFDEIASIKNESEILAYLMSLNIENDFDPIFVAFGTDDSELVHAIWAMEERKEMEEKQKNQLDREQREREFNEQFHVGESYMLDTGWGVLGFQDVIISELRFGNEKDLLVVKVESNTFEWISSDKLLTQSEASSLRLEAFGKVLKHFLEE